MATLEDTQERQRFVAARPCPICGGHKDLPQGHGRRCYGYMDSTGDFARCTREENAGELTQNSDATYSHRLDGACRCGATHGLRRANDPPAAPPTTTVRETTVRHEIRGPDGALQAVHARKGSGAGKRVWWEGKLNGHAPADLIYRAEHLSTGEGPIVLTEGEPAADAVASLGLLAIGTVCGASAGLSAPAASLLSGREVWLWPDADDAGREHMERNAQALEQAGATVRMIEWAAAPPKGDAADYVQAGGTREGVAALLVGAAPPAPDPGPYIDWSEFWSKDRAEAEWVIDRILAKGRGHAIYAEHKVGKSLLTLWCAVQLINAGHVVIYLDYEMGEDDLEERLSDMGCDAATDLSLLRYALLPSLAPLDTREGGQQLLALVDAEQATHPGTHVAVVIDTVSRAVAGEENSNDTIQDFYRYTGLGLKQRGVTWARLDHAGKDAARGARGGSAKGDDVDVIWRLVPTEGGVELKRDAARMSWVPEKVALKIKIEPVLTYETETDESWPMGTIELAGLLDELGVPASASKRSACDALKAAGKGRRAYLVGRAQSYRRDKELGWYRGPDPLRDPPPSTGPGPTSGPTSENPMDMGGTHLGPARTHPHSHIGTRSHTLGGTRSQGRVPDDEEEFPF